MFFFFQAEDGIRDGHVTGVQTCALPISSGLSASSVARVSGTRASPSTAAPSSTWKVPRRSEERRVGKESESHGSGKRIKKKKVKGYHDADFEVKGKRRAQETERFTRVNE